jgi:hypothetical protein
MATRAALHLQSKLGDHSLQLFDSIDSRAEAVSGFVREGLIRGEVVLLVMTEEHWDAVVRRLHAAHVPVNATLSTGQLIVRDAFGAMLLFRRDGVLDRHLFERTAGSLVRRLKSAGNRLRVYGEIVDLLVAEGDCHGAAQLETFWNRLATEEFFTLFCGYSSAHFGHPSHAEALGTICGSHTHVRMHPRDMLGSFLVKMHTAGESGHPTTKH